METLEIIIVSSLQEFENYLSEFCRYQQTAVEKGAIPGGFDYRLYPEGPEKPAIADIRVLKLGNKLNIDIVNPVNPGQEINKNLTDISNSELIKKFFEKISERWEIPNPITGVENKRGRPRRSPQRLSELYTLGYRRAKIKEKDPRKKERDIAIDLDIDERELRRGRLYYEGKLGEKGKNF